MTGSCIHIFLLLIPGLDPRPDCFVFPATCTVGAAGGTVAIGRTSPKRLDCDQERIFRPFWRLEFVLGAKGQPESVAVGNIMMLLMKRSAAQGGSAVSFAHSITLVTGPHLMPAGKATRTNLDPNPDSTARLSSCRARRWVNGETGFCRRARPGTEDACAFRTAVCCPPTDS